MHVQENKKLPSMLLKSINHNKPSIQWYITSEAEGALSNKPQTNTSQCRVTKLTTR
jgi:hypothetical protein